MAQSLKSTLFGVSVGYATGAGDMKRILAGEQDRKTILFSTMDITNPSFFLFF